MCKILDSKFRNDLYKNLTEAGYDKTEAQRIVGVKYFTALKEDILQKVDNVKKLIENNEFGTEFDCSVIGNGLSELNKMDAFLNPKATKKVTVKTEEAE